MPYNIQFDYCRPLGTRIVDVFYVSSPICNLAYYENPTSGDGSLMSL